MPGGFAPRFAVEAGFLILLGVGAGYADLRPIVIVALLAGGWVVVSLIELAVWRSQARPVGAYVPPPPPVPVVAQEEPLPEAEPAPVDEAPAEDEYPLRPGAGETPSEEVEEYTRVLGAPAADEREPEVAE
jgi:hypothetical protein